MCLIAKMKSKADLPRDVITFAIGRNRDGWGFMWADAESGTVKARTGMGGENVLLDAWAEVPQGVEVALHFRMATRGKKDLSNLHPMRVLSKERDGQDLYLMHNGPQITRHCKGDDKRSDTRQFVETILFPLLSHRPRFVRTSTFRRIIEDMTTERVLMLEGCGKWHVFNADSWNTRDGVLYSNTYSLPSNVPAYDWVEQESWWKDYQKRSDGIEVRRLPSRRQSKKATPLLPPGWKLDGAGRLVPPGQDQPSRCPDRNMAWCKKGCSVGGDCMAREVGDQLSRVIVLGTSDPVSTGFTSSVGITPDIVQLAAWKLEDLRQMSTGELFQLVVLEPEQCERYLRSERVTFTRGIASRDPERATDLVIDTLDMRGFH